MPIFRKTTAAISVSVSIALHAASVAATEPERNAAQFRFAYDVDFGMNFDNRELYRSRFSESMTIFGARLTPSAGISLTQSNGTSHKVMVGIDIMKDFGNSPVPPEFTTESSSETSPLLNNAKLFRELIMYYRFERDFGKTSMTLYAGIFPRNFTETDGYPKAFFSDSLAFYDNNMEGLLVKFRRPKANFEAGCDWMGQYGTARRERFMIFSHGEGQVAPVLSLGYSAYMYHFAGARLRMGVVDNFLANPYVRFDLGALAGMQVLSARLGWLQSMQQDRLNVGKYVFPCGGELDLEMRKWNVGISNSLFYGTDMMPYYNSKDSSGYKYGNVLYMGDPFYRVHDDGSGGPGFYDRLEVFYEPDIGGFLKIRIGAMFHFNGSRYSGCQQTVSLKFNLQRLLDRRKREERN